MAAQTTSRAGEDKMDSDDLEPRKSADGVGAGSLASENLDILSVDELEKRVGILEREIERTKAMIVSKQSSHSDAEKFFKS
jgi:uncharacterized small protein (DUF1192 family)